MERYNFIDDDLISVASVFDKDKITPVTDEVKRGGKMYDDRLIKKKLRRKEVKPLYDEARKKKYELSKIAVYRLFCSIPRPLSPYESEYPKCEHKGNVIIDRDVLPQDEHIELLAQPKIRPEPPKRDKRRCHYEKRFLPNCTAHIEDLAIPNSRGVKVTLDTYKNILSARQIDFLSELLKRDKKALRTIERAVELRREECKKKRALKARILKKAALVKRKLKKAQRVQVRDIVYTIYEVMKKFLMTDHKVELRTGLKNLSEVLEQKIKDFLEIPQPCELEKKFIKTLADNLAMWMEKFLSNFGFECLFDLPETEKATCPCEEKELESQIPIDDYIELSEEGEEGEEEGEEEYSDYPPSGANEEWLGEMGEEGTAFLTDAGETEATDAEAAALDE